MIHISFQKSAGFLATKLSGTKLFKCLPYLMFYLQATKYIVIFMLTLQLIFGVKDWIEKHNSEHIRRETWFSKFLKKFNQVEASNFIKKETVAHVFSCEICEIFTEHLRTTASDHSWPNLHILGNNHFLVKVTFSTLSVISLWLVCQKYLFAKLKNHL